MALFQSLSTTNKVKSVALVVAFVCLYTALIFFLLFGIVVLIYGGRIIDNSLVVAAVLAASNALAAGLAVVTYYSSPAWILRVVDAEPLQRHQDPVLFDVVEEVAVAAGLPPPAVYLIDIDSMNALAVGFDPNRAAIAVTRGLRERLDRDELQAVAAHEMARILNYDAALMTTVAGMVGLVLLALAALRCMASDAFQALVKTRNLLPLVLVGVLAVVLFPWLILGPIVAVFIQLAVSRQRQFLADVEGAELSRYPEAMVRALRKLAADDKPMYVASAGTAHLFIVSPLVSEGRRFGGEGTSVWSAHPPIEQRIQRLRSIGNIEG
jgi:heat shock protein HtpX